MKPKKSGWAAILYTLRMFRRVGWRKLWQAMSAKNTCKTCALGMGGQAGGMRNEAGHWPEVCKKSLQAMVADMQAGITPDFFANYSLGQLQALSPRELEWCGRLTTPLYAGPGDTHYRAVDWDFALGRIVDQLRTAEPDENFFYCSGLSSNEAGFVLHLLARLYFSNFVNNCSFYCHRASSVGLTQCLATARHRQRRRACRSLLSHRRQPGVEPSHASCGSHGPARRRGQVIVVNPLKEVGLVNFSVPSDVWSMLFCSSSPAFTCNRTSAATSPC